MRTRLQHYLNLVLASYWFLPAMMLAGAALMAMVLVRIDRGLQDDHALAGWIYGGGPDGARGLLATIGGSVITVAGVVFSITISTLTQASSQFGPRLLRNFIRDTANQIVLGVFVATFLYSLLVLRTIRTDDGGDAEFVPHLSVTVGIVLATASIAVLVYFIHHVSTMLQAPHVIENVWHDLQASIEQLYPRTLGEPPVDRDYERTTIERLLAQSSCLVRSRHSGYVQAVDSDSLMSLLRERDLVAELLTRPGKFVAEGEPIARVHPVERCDDHVKKELDAALLVGAERTSEQDAEFAIDQLVEIAVRALSPGVNDPFTAINVLDRLGAALSVLGDRSFPPPVRDDDEKVPRLLADASDFPGLCDAAFNMIRQNAHRSVAVSIRMLENIERVLRSCPRMPRERVECVVRHAERMFEQSMGHEPIETDQRDLRQRMERVRDAGAACVRAEA